MIKDFSKFDLHGKTALITGAAGLLGKEHAKALLKSGANIVLTDINEEDLTLFHYDLMSQTGSRDRVEIYLMNVSKHQDVLTVAEKLEASNKRIDILVNNAAIDAKVTSEFNHVEFSRLENFPLMQWNRQLEVGLTGAFICSQIFGAKMAQDKKGGVILNIASDLSVIAPDHRLYKRIDLKEEMQPVKPVSYSVIKAGLIGLTRYLSTYWINAGVRSNALSPGGVYHNQNEEFVQRISSLIPLGRMAEVDEYHSVIQFLCSDASAYLNGQNIVMDGGRSVW